MADDLSQPVDQPAGANTSADHEDINWGEDWESAFQAEDDAFLSDGKEEDFFLEENEPTVTAGIAAQDPGAPQGKTLAGIPAQDAASGVTSAKALAVAGALTAILLAGKTAAQQQFARLQSFPIFVRLPLYALPFLLVGVFFVLGGSPEPPPLPQTATSPAQAPGAAAVSAGKATGEAGLPEINQASQLYPGKVRKKWAFPAFVIPANNPASDQPTTFILVDITLILSLEEQEDPPAGKKLFVRDIIYQFFQNKPLAELRRFSLARGEMNRELRAWLQKQWPEAPLESIIFNQYHLS